MLLIAVTRILYVQFIFHSRLTKQSTIPDINDLPESSRSPNEPSTENGPSGHSLPKKRWAYAFLMVRPPAPPPDSRVGKNTLPRAKSLSLSYRLICPYLLICFMI